MATDNIGNDDVFAQLTELFGELLSADLILNVCTTYNWKCKFFSFVIEKIKHGDGNTSLMWRPIFEFAAL